MHLLDLACVDEEAGVLGLAAVPRVVLHHLAVVDELVLVVVPARRGTAALHTPSRPGAHETGSASI